LAGEVGYVPNHPSHSCLLDNWGSKCRTHYIFINFSVEAWINPDVVDASQVSLGNAVDNFEFDVRNGLSLYVRDQVGWGSPAQSGAGTVPAGVWSHVAGIFDGNEIKVYLNGALKATTPRNTTLVSGDFSLNFGTYANLVNFGIEAIHFGLKILSFWRNLGIILH